MTGLGLAPDALSPVALLTLLGLAGLLLASALGRWRLWLATSSLLVAAVVAAFLFRDPERVTAYDPRNVVSPVDGRVVSVEVVPNHIYLDGTALRLAVRSGVVDVRTVRSPADGVVDYVEEADALALIGISTGQQRLLLDHDPARGQLDLLEGQLVDQGARAGRLRGPGVVGIMVPRSLTLLVRPGDRLRSGESVIARMD